MEIVKAEPDQAGEIARLNNAVQQLHAEHYPEVFKFPTDPMEMETFFRDKIQGDDSYVLMARISGNAVGYVWCEIQRKDENLFKHALERIYICQLSVAPEHRRQGVGRELLRAVEHLAKEKGINMMALDSWVFNKQAHRFFESLGFSTFNIIMSKETPKDR
jgi:ribosomal protein S18 acetylase RimI-like enzyme